MTTEPFDGAKSWHVYYCYAADGALLYIGYSAEPIHRFRWHQQYSHGGVQWAAYCAQLVISPPLYRDDWARAVEREEIAALQPAFNVHGNDNPAAWTPTAATPRRAYLHSPSVEQLTDWSPTARSTLAVCEASSRRIRTALTELHA